MSRGGGKVMKIHGKETYERGGGEEKAKIGETFEMKKVCEKS